MATQTQYYNLDKPSYDEVADIEVINANMDKIDQQMRNNADGVNFAKGISSDAYDNSKLYAVGDYCIYDNKLYRCITAIESAEAFNIAKWEQTTVGKEVKQLNSNLDRLDTSPLLKADDLELGHWWNGGSDTSSYIRIKNPIPQGEYIFFNNGGYFELLLMDYSTSGSNLICIIRPEESKKITVTSDTRLYFGDGSKTYTEADFEKAVKSINYYKVGAITETVSRQNESLDDYGLVAKEYVSNDFLQGVDTNGNITSNNYYVCNKNIISANAGDTITVKSIANSESYVAFYDGSTFKSFITIPASSINNFVFSIPSGSNGFRVSIGVNTGVTPSTIGEVKIYTNNAIDELKNDLGNFNSYDLGTISSSDWKSFAKEVFSRVCGKVGAFIATVTFAGHSQCAVFGRAVTSTEGDFIIVTEDVPYTVFIHDGNVMTMYALNGTKM